MNKIGNNLETEIINLLSHCMREKVDINNIQNHPIRVIEAAKSIIGLNLDNPSIRLLNYIKIKKTSANLLDVESDIKNEVETVSIYELEEAIDKNDLNESNKVILNLLKLSDGRHILEYLLELSLKQSGKSLSVIWAIYKALSFIGYSSSLDVRNSLLIAAQSLIYDQYYSLDSIETESLDSIFDRSNLNDYELQIFGIIYELLNEKFIRTASIKDCLESFTKYFIFNLKQEDIKENKGKVSINTRYDLLKILEESEISDRNILNINALRACMKNSNKINKKKLTHYILSILRGS